MIVLQLLTHVSVFKAPILLEMVPSQRYAHQCVRNMEVKRQLLVT